MVGMNQVGVTVLGKDVRVPMMREFVVGGCASADRFHLCPLLPKC